jgi:4-oxalocrotonate tautomerase
VIFEDGGVMPHIAVFMYPGRDDKTKLALSLKLQAFLADELSIDKGIVSVSIEDVTQDNWNEAKRKIPDDTIFVEFGQK